MNITLKLLLYESKTYSNGYHPVVIQYTMNRKRKRKVIHKCKKSDWDSKNNQIKTKVIGSAHTNNYLAEEYAKAEFQLYKLRKGEVSFDNVFEDHEFISLDYAFEQELSRLKVEKKVGTYDRYRGYKQQLKDYFHSVHTDVTTVDIKWFERLSAFYSNDLIIDGRNVKPGNTNNVVQVKIKSIRRVIAKYSHKPVPEDIKNFRVPTTRVVKVKLTREELTRIEELDLSSDPTIDVARDIFLLQVYLRGARVGSILQAYSGQFDNGRYEADNNGGKNNVGAKLIPQAQAIVDKYYGKHERLFPLFKWRHNPSLSDFENKKASSDHKQGCTAMVNYKLKIIGAMCGITKPLSSHIARHTYARMAIDKINNPMITMELLGHSDLKVHQGYLNDIRKDDELDKANDEVFG